MSQSLVKLREIGPSWGYGVTVNQKPINITVSSHICPILHDCNFTDVQYHPKYRTNRPEQIVLSQIRLLLRVYTNVNSEIFVRVLFSRNFAYAKFRGNKILLKWQDHSVVY